jgi:hypothetical protein
VPSDERDVQKVGVCADGANPIQDLFDQGCDVRGELVRGELDEFRNMDTLLVPRPTRRASCQPFVFPLLLDNRDTHLYWEELQRRPVKSLPVRGQDAVEGLL